MVLNWLHHLSHTHSDYHSMNLSMQNLHTLSVNDSVHTLLPICDINEMFNSEFNRSSISDLNDALNHALNTALTAALITAANAALNAAVNAAVNTALTTTANTALNAAVNTALTTAANAAAITASTTTVNAAVNTALTTAANTALNTAANAAVNAVLNNTFDEEINLEPHEVGVPDFCQDETELQHLQWAVQSAPPALSIVSFHQTSLSEWEKKCVFQMAFPFLFLCGLSDFFNPCTHEITFKDWISHVLRYKDEHFTYHSHFCYVAFNMWMHLESKKSVSYLCKQLND